MSHDYSKTKVVEGTCVVCRGEVIRKIRYIRRNGKPSDRMSAYNTTVQYGELHCSNCGIRYEFPPKNQSETPQPG